MKAVIFDLGNVLVKYDHECTLKALASRTALEPSELRDLFATLTDAAGTGEMDAAHLHTVLAETAGLTVGLGEFVRTFAQGITRDEDALAYAVALQDRAGVTVAVISNTNAAHVAWLDEHIPELRHFDLVMMSNEVGMLKPTPAIFRLALELLDVAPADAIFIDDLLVNVEAARALDMAGVVHRDWADTKQTIEAWLAEPTPSA